VSERGATTVDAALVRRLAALCCLELDDAELPAQLAALQRMVAAMAALGEVDVTGVAPLRQPELPWPPARADVPEPCLPAETVAALAPRLHGGAFVVPRMVEAGR
jgi:aspartyl-tRNA(Asn)/glutamyl-tRNA(Gln) amidotransferase subunit C